ncbi:MAG: S8 family serine peptidase [Rhodospirillales bacterium]|nr:S8 family serine peptidase [Rhodospirillales bacterium]
MLELFRKTAIAICVACLASGALSVEALARGKPPPKNQDPEPTPVIDYDAELNLNWAIPFIKAPSARDAGYTGKGITIGVMDSGVANLSEFDGRLLPMWDAYRNRFSNSKDDNGHGTFVAGLSAAARDGLGMVGVAYEANILPIKVIRRNGAMGLNDAQLATAFDVGRLQGATVLNNSWNSSTTAPQLINAYGYDGAVTAINDAYSATLAAMQGFVNNGGGGRVDGGGAAVGGVIVFAAGNDGKSDPGWWASLPEFKPDLAGGYLAAVAVDDSGAITSWSDRCGISQAYCLAAPGAAVISTKSNGTYGAWSGTSFSAPIVSGAVAVIAQQWPYLQSSAVTQILLTTANKSGIYSNTAVYGQGLLDMNAALTPAGEVLLAGSGTTSTSGGGLSASVSSTAFGNFGARGHKVVVLDSYRRDFGLSTSALIDRPRDTFDTQMALSRFGFGGATTEVVNYAGMKTTLTFVDSPLGAYGYNGKGQAARFEIGDGYAVSFGIGVTPQMSLGLTPLGDQWRDLTLADKPLGHGFAAPLQDAVSASMTMPLTGPVKGIELTLGLATGQASKDSIQTPVGLNGAEPWNTRRQKVFALKAAVPVGERAKVALNLGALNEDGAVLGTRQTGTFGLGSDARTSFAGVSGEMAASEKVTLFAGYEMGWTKVNGQTGALVGGVDTLRSTSWRVGMAARGLAKKRDRLLFSVSQPLRVEGGAVTAVLPTSYNGFTDTVGYDTVRSGLAAERREVMVQTAYAVPLSGGVDLSLGGMMRLNPNNENAPADFVGLAKLGWEF